MIEPIGVSYAQYIADHQEMYPEAMREGIETWSKLLQHRMSWGFFGLTNELEGWIIFTPDEIYPDDTAYCYDIAVLPHRQLRGLGQRLWLIGCLEMRWRGLNIRAHCRKTSYHLLSTKHPGYKLAFDVLRPNHYNKEYETDQINEDAHEILLKVIGA